MGRLKLPKGCNYPDCFNCTMPDCILPDDVDLLGDCDIDVAVEELIAKREQIHTDLQAKGLTTRKSVEYHQISNKIHYLKNRDMLQYKSKQRYSQQKASLNEQKRT